MDTATLKRILVEELAGYAGEGLNAHSLLTINEAPQTYAVIDFAQVRDQRIVAAVLVSRLMNDQIGLEQQDISRGTQGTRNSCYSDCADVSPG